MFFFATWKTEKHIKTINRIDKLFLLFNALHHKQTHEESMKRNEEKKSIKFFNSLRENSELCVGKKSKWNWIAAFCSWNLNQNVVNASNMSKSIVRQSSCVSCVFAFRKLTSFRNAKLLLLAILKQFRCVLMSNVDLGALFGISNVSNIQFYTFFPPIICWIDNNYLVRILNWLFNTKWDSLDIFILIIHQINFLSQCFLELFHEIFSKNVFTFVLHKNKCWTRKKSEKWTENISKNVI